MTPVLLTRAALPGMLQRNRGAIINVSSLSAWSFTAGNVQYASTKNYLSVFSQAIQQELLGTRVPHPGPLPRIRPHRIPPERKHEEF